MRVFGRRERPHPRAQLTLFDTADGWRYSLWVTNRPATTRGRLGQNAYLDAAHRVHAGIEDTILPARTLAWATSHSDPLPIGINQDGGYKWSLQTGQWLVLVVIDRRAYSSIWLTVQAVTAPRSWST
jgi:hypothetical protein